MHLDEQIWKIVLIGPKILYNELKTFQRASVAIRTKLAKHNRNRKRNVRIIIVWIVTSLWKIMA